MPLMVTLSTGVFRVSTSDRSMAKTPSTQTRTIPLFAAPCFW
jgi:hypothetical protein